MCKLTLANLGVSPCVSSSMTSSSSTADAFKSSIWVPEMSCSDTFYFDTADTAIYYTLNGTFSGFLFALNHV